MLRLQANTMLLLSRWQRISCTYQISFLGNNRTADLIYQWRPKNILNLNLSFEMYQYCQICRIKRYFILNKNSLKWNALYQIFPWYCFVAWFVYKIWNNDENIILDEYKKKIYLICTFNISSKHSDLLHLHLSYVILESTVGLSYFLS